MLHCTYLLWKRSIRSRCGMPVGCEMNDDRMPSVPDAGAPAARVWRVGALCLAIGQALDARFNPVSVQGEISGFSRASSGHCYFALKDADGQLRCAMFRRAAGLLDFTPADGDRVEVRGRLGVYEPRGDLQLVVESMRRAGQGSLFEQFLRLKEKLQAQGLFDVARKRSLKPLPRALGIVTSLNAAALHDVLTALQRRAPHVPLIIAPALVQGAEAPASLIAALQALYRQREQLDAILLVRGGGSLEDLAAFNDEALARAVVSSPVPVVCGVGHETDFTIADFCADVRAPTPTAAAELAAEERSVLLRKVDALAADLAASVAQHVARHAQRTDLLAARIARPSARLARHDAALRQQRQRLDMAWLRQRESAHNRLHLLAQRLQAARGAAVMRAAQRLERATVRLDALDPRHVLSRGYALLEDDSGKPVTGIAGVRPGDRLVASLIDGKVEVGVHAVRPS